MLRLTRHDLTHGRGVKAGLPRPLAGGVRLGTAAMPVLAAGRNGSGEVELPYAIARGCMRLLSGELSSVELIGAGSEASPSGVHVVLANGKSHCWVVPEKTDAGKVLALRGMPFSSPVVNYNSGLVLGLFLMLQRDHYPDFVLAARKAVAAKAAGEATGFARALALMGDEMHLVVERIMDGGDPLGLQGVILDREPPVGFDTVFDGGEDIASAFTSIDGFDKISGGTKPVHAASAQVDAKQLFVGDLPNKLRDLIMRGKHILLTGPTATGKTLATEEACLALGAPLVTVRGSEGIEDRDLIASVSLVGGDTVTRYGPVPEAMLLGREQYNLRCEELEAARRGGRSACRIPPAVLLIDEINRLQTRHQNFLLSMLNVRRATGDFYLRIPDTNEEVACPDGSLVMIAARNIGGAFLGANPMDLALERRFYAKIQVDYLPPESELALIQSKTGLDEELARVLTKTASDSRYQLPQLKAPLDTDTLLKWAEEVAWLKLNGVVVTDQVVLDVARDIVFDIVIERAERGGFDPAGLAIIEDNIRENWRDEHHRAG